jgi:hypothetical protein
VTIDTKEEKVVFIVRPVIELMKKVATNILDLLKKGSEKQYWLYFVPHKSFICEQVLKDLGVRADLTIGQLNIDLIPFEEDVLSLEMENLFKDCFRDGDVSSLSCVASSIMKLQTLFGVIPNVKVVGRMSEQVSNMIQRMRKEDSGIDDTIIPEIHTLMLIDRDVDLVTPMVSPLTYEALIDEIIGVHNGAVTVDRSMTYEDDTEAAKRKKKDDKPESKTVSVPLNSNDKLYKDIRDYNISILPLYLSDKSKEIRAIRKAYDDKKRGQDGDSKGTMAIEELRDFVKKIPSLKETYSQLTFHINMTEKITAMTNSKAFRDRWNVEHKIMDGDKQIEEIENAMARQQPLLDVVRLLCLQSLVVDKEKGFIKPKVFDELRHKLVHTYGYEMIFLLDNLDKVGLLRKRDAAGPFGNLVKKLNLVHDSNLATPEDMSYVTSGYAPLSCRLVQLTTKGNWTAAAADALKGLNTPTLSITQSLSKEVEDSLFKSEGRDNKRKVMVVYFIGGVTFLEIAALRQLQKSEGCKYDIIVCTTKICSGKTLISSLREEPESALTAHRRRDREKLAS